MIRLFVTAPLQAGAVLTPGPEQSRYLVSVMRQGVGDAILLFNGEDGEWRAVVSVVSKRGCQLTVEARTREQAFPPDLDLIVSLVKRTRLETIIEKAAELGAARVRLVTTQRTNADHARLPRLQAIATEASEQTGRLDVPLVLDPVPLDRLLERWTPGRQLMFCDEAGDDPNAQWGGSEGRARPVIEALAAQPSGPFAVLIGPEGGFAPAERERLRSLPFVVPVTLGPRILRADTAAISAMTLWQASLGDWRPRAAR
jgi:16S rRNA (uracil1498-N3)-methyltransferase